MATYTENYNLKKPTYAEPANVKDINDNMEIIDDVMHNTQISLADAYDQNETYNTGDIVMYEMLMYKCKEDNVTGAWNASKWERTTAGESGGGADLDIYGEASGTAEASFSDGAEASLVKCIVEIEATQSGSGTPSPSNIRPISGHTDVTVTVASTSGGSGENTTVSLGRTVYGGTLDLTTGKLTVTHGFKTYTGDASENWIYTSSLNRVYINIADAIRPSDYAEIQSNILHYSLPQENYGSYINDQGNLIVYAPSDITSSTLWKAWLTSNNLQVVYELATPQTFNLTPTQVLTLLGQNYVSHDGGGTISLVYIKKDSTIIPNPSDAEVPLTGLEIGGEKFKIAGGNGRTEDVLFEQPYLTANPSTITLNHAFTDYDDIQFWMIKKDDSGYYDYLPVNNVPVEFLSDAMNGAMSGRTNVINISGWQPMSQFLRISVTSTTQLSIAVNNSNFLIRKIVGNKH